jgi:hypothetical protein
MISFISCLKKLHKAVCEVESKSLIYKTVQSKMITWSVDNYPLSTGPNLDRVTSYTDRGLSWFSTAHSDPQWNSISSTQVETATFNFIIYPKFVIIHLLQSTLAFERISSHSTEAFVEFNSQTVCFVSLPAHFFFSLMYFQPPSVA